MIQLFAYAQDTETPHLLDVGSGAAVRLNMAFADPGKPLTRSSDYSGAFTLPFTPTNDAFFGLWYEVNLAEGTWSSARRTRCELRSEGQPITEGFLQLRAVNLQRHEYEVAVVGGAGELYAVLGNTPLHEAALYGQPVGALDYFATGQNVVNSWGAVDITAGGLGAGVLRVPLADYGTAPEGFLHYDDGVLAGLALQQYLRPETLKPAVAVDYLFRQCVRAAGFELESNFMQTADWEALYVLIGTQATQLPTRPLYGCNVAVGTTTTITSAAGWVPLQFTTQTGGDFYDPDDLHDGLAFVAPGSMAGTFSAAVAFSGAGLAAPVQVAVRMTRAGTTIASEYAAVLPTTSAAAPLVQLQATAQLEPGEEVQVHVAIAQGTASVAVAPTTTAFTFHSYSAQWGGAEPVDVAACLPAITAADFVRDIALRFNLVLVPHPTNPRLLQVEPLPDYLGTGSTRDWTQRIDQSAAKVLRPTTELQAREVRFTDGVDADYLNKKAAELQGHPLGEYRFTSTDEHATGSTAYEGIFGTAALYPVQRSSGQGSDLPNVVIPALYGAAESGTYQATTTKPKLLFFNGLHTIDPAPALPLYCGTQAFTAYPHFSQYSTRTIGASTWSVRWLPAYRFTTAVLGTGQAQGAFARFWSAYLADIYSAEGRLLEAEVVLDAAEIYTLSFADLVRAENALWRVLDVANYEPGERSRCRVRLLKVLAAVPHVVPGHGCELLWVSSNVDGTTNWEDATGSPATPTAECCTAAGLTYAQGACWWTAPTTGGGGSVPSNPGAGVPGNPHPPLFAGAVTLPHALTGANSHVLPSSPAIPQARSSSAQDGALFAAMSEQVVLLSATGHDNQPVVAAVHGLQDATGTGVSNLRFRDRVLVRCEVEAVGQDVAAYDPANVGRYTAATLTALVQVADGRSLVVHSAPGTPTQSTGRAATTIALVPTTGRGQAGLLDLVQVQLNNGEADVLTSYAVQVRIVQLDAGGALLAAAAILTEDGQPLAAENGTLITLE